MREQAIPRSISAASLRTRDERGVSLTEVLVILGLIATLSLISIPSLVDLLKSFEIRGAASALANGFRQAQSLAMSEHKNFFVVVNPVQSTSAPRYCWEVSQGRRLFAIVEDEGGDCMIADCGTSTEKVRIMGPQWPQGMNFVGVGISDPYGPVGGAAGTDRYKTICYTSRGYVSSLTNVGAVYVGNDIKKKYRRVDVSLAGRVKVQVYKAGAYRD